MSEKLVFLPAFTLTKNGKSPADKNPSAGQIHAGLNPRLKHASLSLTASLVALRAGYIHSLCSASWLRLSA